MTCKLWNCLCDMLLRGLLWRPLDMMEDGTDRNHHALLRPLPEKHLVRPHRYDTSRGCRN